MKIRKNILQMVSLGLTFLLLAGCGAPAASMPAPSPLPSAVATETSTPIPSSPTSVPATSTPIPPTMTSTSMPLAGTSIAKVGHWEGKPAVSFDVGADGTISTFKIEISLVPNKCQVTQNKIVIQGDGTFTFTFGQDVREGENEVQGAFENATSAKGSYSKSIFCVDPSGQAMFGVTGGDTAWSAAWKGS